MDRATKVFIFLIFVVVMTGLVLTGEIPWNWFLGILLCVILGAFLLFLYRLGRWLAASRCPRCGQLFSKKPIRSTVLGIFKKYSSVIGFPASDDPEIGSGDLAPPHLAGQAHIKYKIHYRCERCSFEWEAVQVERLS